MTLNRLLSRLIAEIPTIVIMLFLGAVLIVGLRLGQPLRETVKNYCLEHGSAETGAINLVTALYLEYRAFDTLGETIVLLVSIVGVVFLLEQRHA